MKNINPYRRITFEALEEDVMKIQRILPWGAQTKLLRGFIKYIIRTYNEKGSMGIVDLMKKFSEETPNED